MKYVRLTVRILSWVLIAGQVWKMVQPRRRV